MLDRPAQCGVAVLNAGGSRTLRRQTVLRTDNDSPVTSQPRNDRQQTIETAPHDEPSPVQREEQRTGPTTGGILRGPNDRHGKPCSVLTDDIGITRHDIGMPSQELRPDLLGGSAPARNVLHRHGAEDAKRFDAFEQSGRGTVVGRTGGERLMRVGHAVTVTP